MINRFPCTRCATSFDSMLEFRDHTINSHFQGDLYEEFKYYTCLTCEDTSESKEIFVKHVNEKHPQEAKERLLKIETLTDENSRIDYQKTFKSNIGASNFYVSRNSHKSPSFRRIVQGSWRQVC